MVLIALHNLKAHSHTIPYPSYTPSGELVLSSQGLQRITVLQSLANISEQQVEALEPQEGAAG